MKKTTIYVLIGMLAITTSCKEEANQKKVPKEEKEVFVTDSSYDPEAALAKMGIELKTPTAPVANYVNLVRSGNLIFLSGKGPSKEDGSYITGKLGKDLSIEEGYEAARMTGINQLVVLKAELGNLNRVKRIVKTFGCFKIFILLFKDFINYFFYSFKFIFFHVCIRWKAKAL